MNTLRRIEEIRNQAAALRRADSRLDRNASYEAAALLLGVDWETVAPNLVRGPRDLETRRKMREAAAERRLATQEATRG